MKKKDLQSLRKKETKDLQKMVSDKKKQIAENFIKLKAGQEKNFKKMANLKKEVAQIMTVIKEKEIIEKETKKEEKK
jgi:ribosomal protein L29